MAFRVEVDPGKCIGCLVCTRCDNFVCGNDFKAHAVKSEVIDVGCNHLAAEMCPVGAIWITVADPNLNNSR